MTRRTWAVLAGTVAAGALVVTAAIVLAGPSSDGGRGDGGCAAFRFDRDAWVASESADPLSTEGARALDARRRQADALVRCDTLEGLSRSRVYRMLGVTDTRKSRRRVLPVIVGPSRGMMIDSEILEVRFRAGRVVAAELVTY
ncbi:MAG: hypothetical protein M3389_00360 [Actinomycetota bacterium]|nr:hypothetical protein [Actinomycetota bacterium]